MQENNQTNTKDGQSQTYQDKVEDILYDCEDQVLTKQLIREILQSLK